MRNDVLNFTNDYVTRFSTADQELSEKLVGHGIAQSALQKEFGARWEVDKNVVDHWIEGSSILAKVDGSNDHHNVSSWHIPVTRSWFAYQIASGYKRHIDHTPIKPSDRYDWDHYGNAAVPGCLVTDDGPFRKVVSRINLGYVRLLTGREFVDRLCLERRE